MEKYSIRRGKLSVWNSGAGNALLLIHGFPFDHAMWGPSGGRLAAEFRVIAPDLRGFGGSVKPGGEEKGEGESQRKPAGQVVVEMESFADDLAELLDALGEKKAILCGLSMGGYIALRFVEKYSEKLSGLILCDTKTAADSPEAARNRLALAANIFKTGTDPLPEQMIPNLLAAERIENSPETVDFLRQMILRQPPEGIAAAARGMAVRGETTALLEKIRVPTLVLRGTEDKLSPRAVMSEMAEKIPNAEFVEIPGAGHLPPLEQPEAFADAVLAWTRKNF